MDNNGTFVAQINAVDYTAPALYQRAKASGPAFQDVAVLVRRIHTLLRHLKVEAEDPDSLLNSENKYLYARQLAPQLEACGSTFKQLESLLDIYGDSTEAEAAKRRKAGDEGDEQRERGAILTVRTKLFSLMTSVYKFLDLVQLHNPSKAHRVIDESAAGLDNIKDKVDAIAAKICHRRDSGFSEDGEDLWQEFQVELEKEGFSRDVLHKNKDVLRAYIRELESSDAAQGGPPPSVRGLLEQERKNSSDALALRTTDNLPPYPLDDDEDSPFSPKEMFPSAENEKYIPIIKAERRMPEQNPYAPHHSPSDEGEADGNMALALISTRDLMQMDTMNNQMAVLRVAPGFGASPGTSPQTHFLPSNVAGALPAPNGIDIPGANSSNALSVSRLAPSMPPYGTSPYGTSPGRVSRLGPDGHGMDIPLEAKWTKIRRTLVSPEVLQRAGVRYEARPDYVAVLGVLSRDEIAEYARQSADCRAARSGTKGPPVPPKLPLATGSTSSEGSASGDLWDSSDSSGSEGKARGARRGPAGAAAGDKGTRSYPVIVERTSPASTALPKSILKNKNENRVRFSSDGPREIPPEGARDSESRSRRRHHRHEPHRERDRDRDRDRDHNRDHNRDRDRDKGHRRSHRSERSDKERREDRSIKKKAWGETLGAVGIGGAAASLLSVLTEAAAAL